MAYLGVKFREVFIQERRQRDGQSVTRRFRSLIESGNIIIEQRNKCTKYRVNNTVDRRGLTGIVSHWSVIVGHRLCVSIDSDIVVGFRGIPVATDVQEAAAGAVNVTGGHPAS